MIPVVTPAEMAAIDAAAPEPIEVLIDRAGSAVAWAARRMLGGCYGRRVLVIAGKGNNGADGRVAVGRLRSWGCRVDVIDPAGPVPGGPFDLCVDAAYGTGLRRPYEALDVPCPVLAVDIASGLDGLTGEVRGRAFEADATLTFAALKPGLLLGDGPAHSGVVEVADIGLDVSGSTVALVEDGDISRLVPARSRIAHKWHSACWVVGGSAGMEGAAALAAGAAMRAGAGYGLLSNPGSGPQDRPIEVVHRPLGDDLATEQAAFDRVRSVVIGPGLGRDEVTAAGIAPFLAACSVPVVVDGDALHNLSPDDPNSETVLTPHDGEYTALMGERPSTDRLASVRRAAERFGCVVLMKGPATLVAEPSGRVAIAASADQRLATAGTGDVLAGLIGGFLARGATVFDAAAAAAHVHGRLTGPLPSGGVVASDLLDQIPSTLDQLGVR